MAHPTTAASTKPLHEILKETATSEEDSEEDSEEVWTDAHEEIPTAPLPAPPGVQSEYDAQGPPIIDPTHPEPHFPRTEYPEGVLPEDKFTDEEIQNLLEKGELLKTQGNDRFRTSDWEGAIKLYQDALRTVPPRIPPPIASNASSKGKSKDGETPEDGPDNADEDDVTIPNATSENANAGEDVIAAPPPVELTELEKECAASRAAVNGNIAACYVKLDKHEDAVRMCTEALLDNPKHIKVLQRRATSNEAIGSWTALAAAEKDYNALLLLLPPKSPLQPQVSRSLRALPARIEVAKKKETDEMMGKLKDLGNTVLGKFGLSTDNFQFTPNGQGGYSMNFVR
ncbi:hypothetical protein FRB98_002462 [Tulasnella sp. 332]|nr:hypothetical protein FRB98_002462 [Tulasnella sp. 332]